MSDTEKTLSKSIGGIVVGYPWLILDVLFFLLVATAFLGYKDFDSSLQLIVQKGFVLLLWFFFLSGLHLLIYVRVSAYSKKEIKKMHCLISYGLFALKAGGLVIMYFTDWFHL